MRRIKTNTRTTASAPNEPEWFRQAKLLSRLGQFEAMLHLYYPVFVASKQVRDRFLDEHFPEVLTERYWEWYSTHHEEVDAISAVYDPRR